MKSELDKEKERFEENAKKLLKSISDINEDLRTDLVCLQAECIVRGIDYEKTN